MSRFAEGKWVLNGLKLMFAFVDNINLHQVILLNQT